MGAITKREPDRFVLAIAEAEAAIEATRASTDPAYVIRPWRRDELIEELQERIASIKREQQRQAEIAAQKAAEASRRQRFAELAPQRQALAERWNRARAEVAAVLAAATALQREHLEQTQQKAIAETPTVQALIAAEMEASERWILLRRTPLQ